MVTTRRAATERDAALPAARRDAGYVGHGACRSCHADAYDSWHASYHRTMTQAVGPDTVLADFGATLPEPHGVQQRGDTFWVHMAIPTDASSRAKARAPAPSWHRVVMSTGSHHLQMFWIRDSYSGRLIAFPWSYLIADARWVPNEATLLRPDHGDVRYVWNEVCVMCHAVAGQPGLDDHPLTTRATDLGIACEACHGPGREHVEHYRSPLARMTGVADEPATAIVNPGRLSPRKGSQVCGQCHSVWMPVDEATWRRDGLAHRPGQDFTRHANLVLHPVDADQSWIDDVLADDADFLVGRFWADGMIRVVGREYNALIASPCYASERFGCTSCHSMHDYRQPCDQLTKVGIDASACSDCHDDVARGIEAHTHHDATSTGSNCYDCHMPHTSYGLLGAVRSHEVDSPSVATARATGRPTACNLCHIDQSLAWTERWLGRWYGHPVADSTDDADTSNVPEVPRLLLTGDAGQRALAAWHLAWPPAVAVAGSTWQADLLARLADDPYPALRLIAQRSRQTLSRRPVTTAALSNTSPSPFHLTDGRLDRATIDRLLANRNDRPIDLRE